MNHLPIVGARFRPPADTILGNLQGETPVVLVREPGNEYDSNAIQVQLPAGWQAAMPPEVLRQIQEAVQLADLPFPSDDANFQLGFVPKGLAAELAPMMDSTGEDISGAIGFLPTGAPCVILEEEEEEELEEEEEEDEIEE